jgi:biopolymer transport protein ExbD
MSNLSREPNVTPMLDVMLTLIIIFMFLAQQFILNRDVAIHEPSAKEKGNASAVALVAGPHETLWLNGHEVSPAALAASLHGAPVEVSAQPGASYRDVFHALDVARTAGARVLGLANKR